MAELVVIGFGDEATAETVDRESRAAGSDLALEPDAMAWMIRDGAGNYQVTTGYSPVTVSGTWGVFWELLFGSLFFAPVLGMTIGPGLQALMAAMRTIGVEGEFGDQAREILQPGTSATFLVAAPGGLDDITSRLGEYGGTIITAKLLEPGFNRLRDELHGLPPRSGFPRARSSVWSVL